MTIARRAACTQYAGNGSWNRSKEFVAEFFEDLGWCVLQGALPMPLVWSAFSYEVEHYWPMLEKEIKDIRTKRNDKTLFTDFELLRSRCKRFTRKKNRWSSSAIPIHIDDFVKSETQKLGHYSRLRDKKRIIVPHSNRNGKQGKSSRRAKGARG
ncbi:MAG: hypothetical protein OZ917_05670 [Candidatus Brocadiaceae bacterium]|nr:hypothetical protein [Candidatus Brocadiaceae bacterium]